MPQVGSNYIAPSRRCQHILIAIAMLAVVAAANAQSSQMPAPNDPELYLSALHFIRYVHQEASVRSRKESEEFHAALRREIGIQETDLTVLLSAADRFDSGLKSPAATEPGYRQTFLTGLVHDLSTSLSPKGWLSMKSFVEGPFRASSRVVKVDSPRISSSPAPAEGERR